MLLQRLEEKLPGFPLRRRLRRTGLGKTRDADYKTRNLETEVRRLLGNAKLKDLKKRVLIPAFDLDNPPSPLCAPCYGGASTDGEQPAYKVALYLPAQCCA